MGQHDRGDKYIHVTPLLTRVKATASAGMKRRRSGYSGDMAATADDGDLLHYLGEASEANDAAEIEALLAAKEGLDISSPYGAGGLSALHRAALAGSMDAMHALLGAGADTDLAEPLGGRTALHFAALRLDLPAVKALVLAGAETEARDSDGRTPLHLACIVMRRRPSYLPSFPPTSNSSSSSSSSSSSFSGDDSSLVPLYLLEVGGAAGGTQDKFGRTPLDAAVSRGCADVVAAIFREVGEAPRPSPASCGLLYEAVRAGDVRIVSELVAAGWEVGMPKAGVQAAAGEVVAAADGEAGAAVADAAQVAWSPVPPSFASFPPASSRGDARRGVCVDANFATAEAAAAAAGEKLSPLMLAADSGRPEVVRALLRGRRGGFPNAGDARGYTALHFATMRGSVGIVEALLRGREGRAVTAPAIQGGGGDAGDREVGRDGVEAGGAGGRPASGPSAGSTGSAAAAAAATVEVADPDRQNADGDTALHVAVATGRTDVGEVLLQAGASVRVANRAGHTALHFAAALGLSGFAKRLLDRGADIAAGDGAASSVAAAGADASAVVAADAAAAAAVGKGSKGAGGSSRGETEGAAPVGDSDGDGGGGGVGSGDGGGGDGSGGTGDGGGGGGGGIDPAVSPATSDLERGSRRKRPRAWISIAEAAGAASNPGARYGNPETRSRSSPRLNPVPSSGARSSPRLRPTGKEVATSSTNGRCRRAAKNGIRGSSLDGRSLSPEGATSLAATSCSRSSASGGSARRASSSGGSGSFVGRSFTAAVPAATLRRRSDAGKSSGCLATTGIGGLIGRSSTSTPAAVKTEATTARSTSAGGGSARPVSGGGGGGGGSSIERSSTTVIPAATPPRRSDAGKSSARRDRSSGVRLTSRSAAAAAKTEATTASRSSAGKGPARRDPIGGVSLIGRSSSSAPAGGEPKWTTAGGGIASKGPGHSGISNGGSGGGRSSGSDSDDGGGGRKDRPGKEGRTPLHHAATNGRLETTRVLLEAGAHPAHRGNGDRESPLLAAARNGHTGVVRLLLEKLAPEDVDMPNSAGETPLTAACAGGHAAIVEQLLRGGAGVSQNYTSSCRRRRRRRCLSPLETAVSIPVSVCSGACCPSKSRAQIVRTLLAAKADPNGAGGGEKGGGGRSTPLHAACRIAGPCEIAAVKALLEGGADADADADADWDMGAGADAGPLGGEGGRMRKLRPLHVAAAYGNAEAVSALTLHGCRLDAKTLDPSGSTPLVLAVQRGHAAAARALIEAGAAVDVVPRREDGSEWAPSLARLAAEHGRGDLVSLLARALVERDSSEAWVNEWTAAAAAVDGGNV